MLLPLNSKVNSLFDEGTSLIIVPDLVLMLLRLLLLLCVLLLKSSSSLPTEGKSMTLTCEVHTSLQKPRVQFQFCFFRDNGALTSTCNSSSKLEILAMRTSDSGSYWCEAKPANGKVIRSSRLQIRVHRVPVSDVSLETQPPGGQVAEGEKLVLVCSVTRGTGDITFVWYKVNTGLQLGTKTQRSLTAEFEILMVKESDAEQYYCTADNGYIPQSSGLVSVTVRIPVSRPVLTLRTAGAQVMVGDVVELHCEAQRGSPPILYQFYHKDVILGSSWASSEGGSSFNLSLAADHSGNYSCEAGNSLGTQHSEAVLLNVTVPPENSKRLLTSGSIAGLLSILSTITVLLLFCYWIKRKIGRQPARISPRSPPSPLPQHSTYLNSPSPVPLQPVYENVNLVSGNDVYSLVYSVQQEQGSAPEPSRTFTDEKVSLPIYSKLKKATIAAVDYSDHEDYEDAM
ncbi:PREDICTED: Fc receptor-like protein 1 [Elephantulus edwardii]|uniref:Fc receptor-like protein 1 n=1 Tax=Elephantulus edwardii TaxID=28737 RepID=UPI0003F086C2|nr:PREDICTED: Fc receptor-like protein 1 [Elephantulus edwardii]